MVLLKIRDGLSLLKRAEAAHPEKIEIEGGHSDINRSLKDKGLSEIYEDSDETKHGDD